MDNATPLYRLAPASEEVERGLDLIVSLSGFTDAGQLSTQLDEAILNNCEHEIIAEFDAEILYDYRARRPMIFFNQDHLAEYAPPQLALEQVTDVAGKNFLYLHGFEPDFRWETVVSAVMELIDVFGVRATAWVQSIPMPVPHTRPIRATISGNRQELIDRYSVWRPATRVPSSIQHLLEYRLVDDADMAHPVAGIVLLTPHYLGENEFPDVALAAIDLLADAAGVALPTERLRAESAQFAERVAEQTANNEEFAGMLAALEERNDSYMASRERDEGLKEAFENLPTADELGAEFESFLAAQARKTDRDSDAD